MRPPPKAEYNFPNNPDVNKFWGTPTSRAFFKSLGVTLAISAVVWGGNLYFTRNDKGPFGFDITKTKEELEEENRIRQLKLEIKPYNLPIGVKSDQVLVENKMKFDDGIEFRPR